MDRLYTPWRMKYVTATSKRVEGCIFCNKLKAELESDRENFVVYRGQSAVVMMNIYPYNTGHLMIIPQVHASVLVDVSAEAQLEMMVLTTFFTELLSQLMHPDGFNIGLNVGRAAGAGIDDHLHLHLVPRWSGDSNFMPVIGQTRVLPEELGDTYDKIVAALRQQPPEIPALFSLRIDHTVRKE